MFSTINLFFSVAQIKAVQISMSSSQDVFSLFGNGGSREGI